MHPRTRLCELRGVGVPVVQWRQGRSPPRESEMWIRILFARRVSVSRRGKRKGSKRDGYWAAVCGGLPAHSLVEFEPRVWLGSTRVVMQALVEANLTRFHLGLQSQAINPHGKVHPGDTSTRGHDRQSLVLRPLPARVCPPGTLKTAALLQQADEPCGVGSAIGSGRRRT